MPAVFRQTRQALAECITYRLVEAIDRSVLIGIQADVHRTLDRVMVGEDPMDVLGELRKVLHRAWRLTGEEVLAEMLEAQAQLLVDGALDAEDDET